MRKALRHYEENAFVPVSPKELFAYVDDHAHLSSHMSKSSWMMGGGRMNTHIDKGRFQKVGSHLKMDGTVLGIKLFLDEIVTQHEPPVKKEWQTVGNINLLVIDHYRLGFQIEPDNSNSKLKVYIDYDLPKSPKTCLLGFLFGKMYAKWCVNQMINGMEKHFK